MNEATELHHGIPASDAAALCNALGWSVDQVLGEFAVQGVIRECAWCKRKFAEGCGNCCSHDCAHVAKYRETRVRYRVNYWNKNREKILASQRNVRRAKRMKAEAMLKRKRQGHAPMRSELQQKLQAKNF